MKTTKSNIQKYVRKQLATNPTWATKALVRIFQENQTDMEKAAETTIEDNGIGFSGTDGQFLSSLAQQFLSRGSLSEKQMAMVHKCIPKYCRQVISMSNEAQLKKLVEAAT